MNMRYANEPEFRQYMIMSALRYKKNNRLKVNATVRKWYNKMPEGKKEERLQKIRDMRAKGLWKS